MRDSFTHPIQGGRWTLRKMTSLDPQPFPHYCFGVLFWDFCSLSFKDSFLWKLLWRKERDVGFGNWIQ